MPNNISIKHVSQRNHKKLPVFSQTQIRPLYLVLNARLNAIAVMIKMAVNRESFVFFFLFLSLINMYTLCS